MGSVKIDIHKRSRLLDQDYALESEAGVLATLANIHQLRTKRLQGDIEIATMLLDFMDAYRMAGLTKRELTVLYWRYEEQYSLKEVAKLFGISPSTVSDTAHRAAAKIAAVLQGGDRDER